jgi:hypothetical protein
MVVQGPGKRVKQYSNIKDETVGWSGAQSIVKTIKY